MNLLTCLAPAANVYSILPKSGWKVVSVWIMLIHNISAFTLHTNPLLYMWERIIHRPYVPYIKLPSRIPVCKSPLARVLQVHSTLDAASSKSCHVFELERLFPRRISLKPIKYELVHVWATSCMHPCLAMHFVNPLIAVFTVQCRQGRAVRCSAVQASEALVFALKTAASTCACVAVSINCSVS